MKNILLSFSNATKKNEKKEKKFCHIKKVLYICSVLVS